MLLVYRVGRQDRGHQWTPPQPSQVCHQVVDLGGVDLRIVPFHAVPSLPEHPPDLTLHQAAGELLEGGLPIGAVGHTCLGGVVEELIVLNPEGDVPGLVVCPTVVGGHGLVRLVDVFSLQGQVSGSLPGWTPSPLSHGQGSGRGRTRCPESERTSGRCQRPGRGESGLPWLSVVDAVSLQGQRRRSGETVTVYPLSQGDGGNHQGAQHGTTGDALVVVDLVPAGELNPSGAPDRIDGQAVNGGAVLTDSENHRLVWLMRLVYRVWGGGRCPPCASCSGGCQGGFQADLPLFEQGIIYSDLLVKLLGVCLSSGEAIEQAKGLEIFPLVISACDDSVNFHGLGLVDVFSLQGRVVGSGAACATP